jgi:hypothetical protein
MAVVRPDRFVFGAVRAEDAPALARAVHQALGSRTGAGAPVREEAVAAGI